MAERVLTCKIINLLCPVSGSAIGYFGEKRQCSNYDFKKGVPFKNVIQILTIATVTEICVFI